MAKVLISGGNGLVGKSLSRKLLEKGYEVAILSRTKKISQEIQTYYWDLDTNTLDTEAFHKVDYIIHLAGVNIGGKRWTPKRKQEILDSRVKSAALIQSQLNAKNQKPKAFITASAVGYYGAITSQKIFEESDNSYDDFLGQTCKAWEGIADNFADKGIRTVKIRTGIVLAKNGGALAKLILPIKLGIGSSIGNGKQYLPWIHIDDLCNIYIQAIENHEMIGPYNAVAPTHHTNKEFTRAIAQKLRRPLWFPNIPSFALKLLLGEMADILLYGSRVAADKIIDTGFQYIYENLEKALDDVC